MRSRPYGTTMLWVAVVALAFVSNAVLQLRNIRIVADNEAMVSHTNQVRAEIFALGSSLKDAQRGARGFIITSNARDLEPYHRAIAEYADHLEFVRKLTADNHSQQSRLDDLQPKIAVLMNLLGSEVEEVQAGNRNAPEQSVRVGTANSEMDSIQAILNAMVAEEDRLLALRSEQTFANIRRARISLIIDTVVALLLLSFFVFTVVRNRREQEALNRGLELRVRDRTAELQETNQSLEAFTYSVSHDLRAPLRGMHGLGTALIEDYGEALDATAKQYLDGIIKSAKKMDALVEDLLTYSRVSRGAVEIQPVNLSSAVREAFSQVQSDIAGSGAEVVIRDGAGFTVQANRSLLNQAVANLLSNAIKFVPAGVRPRVEIEAQGLDAAVRLRIKDNGIGIPEDAKERIFLPFERLHGAETYPGSGLGLAIAKKAVERMSGRIGLETKPGAGSEFWIELPKPTNPIKKAHLNPIERIDPE